ncbi:hypothetical protein CRG98_037278 [Punica granatum]|uniref:Reverse transcriptase/retrotransposon-derived protein RNase H-like domain-containing protein n=1 Tax=Punica granatum TaxID=22663 RepID=A0A2I0IEV7_PUNGR|nr:hypothetical protein CRG98_037278 [Punica granatum]
MEELILSYIQKIDTMLQNQQATIRNLEGQISQIYQQLSNRPSRSLPSNTEENPKGVNAIMLRSGKELDTVNRKAQTQEESPEKDKGKQKVEEPRQKSLGVKLYVPPVPFPGRMKQQHLDAQFAKFLNVFKMLQINIPFVEALQQMPSYARFMKDLLTKKRKIDGSEPVMLTGECSMILQKDLPNLPRKQRDHGSFTVPCTIGNFHFEKVLIDSGASINLMHLSIFRKLGLGECKETHITLQLADKSIKYPKGIVKNVLVKVEKFIFPVDFIVLEMEEDREVSMILGRSFLVTGKALIDVEQGVDTMESVLRDLDDWSVDDEPEEEYVEKVSEIKALYYEELGTSATKPICLQAFNLLKEKLTFAPVIVAPDWELPYELMCDAGDYAVRAVLGQKRGKLNIIQHCHSKEAGCPFGVERTAAKILSYGFYWPRVFMIVGITLCLVLNAKGLAIFLGDMNYHIKTFV